MTKITKYIAILFAVAALPLLGVNRSFADDMSKQLEKGKALFAQQKDHEAMDYFIDVMLSGNGEQAEEANRYINLIHNRLAGIQTPVEVDVSFQEGAVRHAKNGAASAARSNATPYTEADKEIAQTVAEEDNAQDAQKDLDSLGKQNEEEKLAAQSDGEEDSEDFDEENDSSEYEEDGANGVFRDLTSDSALEARALYTQQKLQSMKDAVIARIRDTKGVRIYFRNGQPDAIDMDGDVIFDGNKFKKTALPLLDEIYSLMALTSNASYVILPPGSYTDDVALPGIRQAMALNSFLVHKGISSGKISYNMGLYDQEPPAKFANLEGLSIVFDYEADLPAQMSQAISVSKLPLLSMAMVPVSNKIDLGSGQAFVIDFSVIETVEPIENWVFQIIQHGADGKYYVVRQLEGFTPVYHQILWNGRKGIIGPELANGKYTFVLTATDVKGQKRTLRRLVQVTGTAMKESANSKADDAKLCPKCNYKTARLWKKPGRKLNKTAMAQEQQPEPVQPQASADAADQQPEVTDPFADMPDTLPTEQEMSGYDNDGSMGDNAPYDMPYDQDPL